MLKLLFAIILIMNMGTRSAVTPEPPRTVTDPFTVPPIGTSPNCGPEWRYTFQTVINSKDDLVTFLQNNTINQWVRFDNFRGAPDGVVQWDRIRDAIRVERTGQRMIYTLNYNPEYCHGFTLKMSNDGLVSLYGCCGE